MPLAFHSKERWMQKPPAGTRVELDESHWLVDGNLIIAMPMLGGRTETPENIAAGRSPYAVNRFPTIQSGTMAWAINKSFNATVFQPSTNAFFDLASPISDFPLAAVVRGFGEGPTVTDFLCGVEDTSNPAFEFQLQWSNRANDECEVHIRAVTSQFTKTSTATNYATEDGTRPLLIGASSPAGNDHDIYFPDPLSWGVLGEHLTDTTNVGNYSTRQLDRVYFSGSLTGSGGYDFFILRSAAIELAEYEDLLKYPYAWYKPVRPRTMFLPAAGGGATVTPSPVSEPMTTVAPVVAASGSVALTPSPISELFTVPAPTVAASGNVAVTPDPVSEPFVVPAPTVGASGNVAVAPDPVSELFTVPAPSLNLHKLVTPDPVSELFTVPAPTVSVSGSAQITPDPIYAPFLIPNPTVTGGEQSPVGAGMNLKRRRRF